MVLPQLRWHEGWCVSVVYMGGSAYGGLAKVEGTFIWVCLIDMLGSMGEQKASLQSLPIQSRSPGPPHAGARHPISHNHSTELKDTAHPPTPHPLPASLNTQMETGTHILGNRNQTRHTYAHRQSNTQNPYWSWPPCCTRGPTLFWRRGRAGSIAGGSRMIHWSHHGQLDHTQWYLLEGCWCVTHREIRMSLFYTNV